MGTQQLACKNADCNFASDGKCVEGYEVEECPHAGVLSINDIPEADDMEAPSEPSESTIALASGETLRREDASDLQRRYISRSVGLIGPADSGKTSLIAGVFDLLQMAPSRERLLQVPPPLSALRRFAILLGWYPDGTFHIQKEQSAA